MRAVNVGASFEATEPAMLFQDGEDAPRGLGVPDRIGAELVDLREMHHVILLKPGQRRFSNHQLWISNSGIKQSQGLRKVKFREGNPGLHPLGSDGRGFVVLNQQDNRGQTGCMLGGFVGKSTNRRQLFPIAELRLDMVVKCFRAA